MPKSKKLITVELTGADKQSGESAKYPDLKKNIRAVFKQIRHDGEWYASVSYSIFSLHELKSEVWDSKQRKCVFSKEADEKKKIDKHFSNWHCHLIVYAEQDCIGLCEEIKSRWVNVCKQKDSRVKALEKYQLIIPCGDTGKIIYTLWQELHNSSFPCDSTTVRRKIIAKAHEEFPKGKDSATLKNWRYSIEQGLQQFTGSQYLINLAIFSHDEHAHKQNEQVEKLWAQVGIARDIHTMSKIVSKVRRNLAQKDLRKLMQNYHESTWKELDLEYEDMEKKIANMEKELVDMA